MHRDGELRLRLVLDDSEVTLGHMLTAQSDHVAPALEAVKQKREG
jgi:hypothetical protein